MDDIFKDKVRRALARFDLRIQKCRHLKYPFDKANFSGIAEKATIFDVGANIGQTALWFLDEFPHASIYSFEPFQAIYDELVKNTRAHPTIRPFHFGMSSSEEKLSVARAHDAHCLTSSITNTQTGEDAELIEVRTIDSFCSTNGIERIDILKTDTEGHDIQVLEGASAMLREGRIGNVLSEASIRKESNEQTNFFQLCAFLEGFGFDLFSLYDLRHDTNTGRLNYFNALFKPAPCSPK